MELILELFKIGGPTALSVAVLMWFVLRAEARAEKSEDFIREILPKKIEADFKMAESFNALARSHEATMKLFADNKRA